MRRDVGIQQSFGLFNNGAPSTLPNTSPNNAARDQDSPGGASRTWQTVVLLLLDVQETQERLPIRIVSARFLSDIDQ